MTTHIAFIDLGYGVSDGDYYDVSVTTAQPVTEVDYDGREVTTYAVTDDVVLRAKLGVRVGEDDDGSARVIAKANRVLGDAGWARTSEWVAGGDALYADVTR